MAKDLVDNAANNLLKEALAILEGEGSNEDKVENAIDHLKLGFAARKLALKRQASRADAAKVAATAAEKPAIAKTSTPTVSATPKVDTVVAAQANGKTDQKGGWLGK